MRPRWLQLRKRLLRTSIPLLALLPPRSALAAVGQIGRLEYRLRPSLRDSYREAIGRVAAHFGASWDLDLVGADLAANQIRHRARDLLVEGRTDDQLRAILSVSGRSHLDATRPEAGRPSDRGVILLGNHFGAHLIIASWMIRRGYPWRMYGERPRHVSKLLNRHFAAEGAFGQRKLFISRKANPAEAAGAILRASRALRHGICLSIAADVRWTGPLTTAAGFLGRTYSFSSTWVKLASLSRCPVVPAFCAMSADGTYRLEFDPPFHVPPKLDPASEARWVQHGLDLIERRVRDDPANSIDYFFWDDFAAAPPAEAMAG